MKHYRIIWKWTDDNKIHTDYVAKVKHLKKRNLWQYHDNNVQVLECSIVTLKNF